MPQDLGEVRSRPDALVDGPRGPGDGDRHEVQIEAQQLLPHRRVQEHAVGGEPHPAPGPLGRGDHLEEARMQQRLSPPL